MIHPPARTLAAALAAGVLLTGCSTSDPTAGTGSTGNPSSSAPASPSASASASPTSTLTAEEQQAVEEAAEAVRRYEQMFYDILSDPEPSLNDMNEVAAQPQLALDLTNLQSIIGSGGFTIESSGPTAVLWAKPVRVDLEDEPPVVVLLACVDQTRATGTQGGEAWTGPREQAEYRVVKAAYLPPPGWAVAKVLPPKGSAQPQPC